MKNVFVLNFKLIFAYLGRNVLYVETALFAFCL